MHGSQALSDVVQRAHVRKQIELLKYHAGALAHTGQFGLGVTAFLFAGSFRQSRADDLSSNLDRARAGRFHEVDASQQRAFARTRSAENCDAVARKNVQVDALEHFVVPELFAQVADAQKGFVGG